MSKSESQSETLAIPTAVREAIDVRDGRHCRVCGRYLGEQRAIHHIVYGGDERGMGGRRVHDIDQMVTVCWLWAGNCHDRVHADKHLWQPLLLDVAQRSGITALQLYRWRRARTAEHIQRNVAAASHNRVIVGRVRG